MTTPATSHPFPIMPGTHAHRGSKQTNKMCNKMANICMYIIILQKEFNKSFGLKVDDSQNETLPRKLVIKPRMQRRIGTKKHDTQNISFSTCC